MAINIILPKQGLQMTEGTIIRWLKSEGEVIKEGEPLFEMETDKLTITIDATAGGTLLKILHPAGDVVPITETIAIVGTPGEMIDEPAAATAAVPAAISEAPAAGTYDYDTVVLGGGPGGYEAAIRCAQYGLNTALIEARDLGGTCLNRGCIPTKALLHGAELFEEIENSKVFGIKTGECAIDFGTLTAFKDKKVEKLRRGIASLEKSHGVTVIKGFGKLTDVHTIEVDGKKVTTDKVILATGSAPARPPIPGADGPKVMTSDEVLAMKELPESFVIIGGGVIGMEFTTLFATLGKKVTVLEMMPFILPGVDEEIVKTLKRSLVKKGVAIVNEAKVTGIVDGDGKVSVEYELAGEKKSAEGACCIISVGRRPQTKDIGLENLGVEMNRAFVAVDDGLKTSVDNIYAVGDITGKIQLAHVASAQGLVAAANCAGKKSVMHYDIVPACIYTSPEIAYVGLTEDAAKKQGKNVKTGSFNVAGNGRAMVMNAASGVSRIVTDASTGEILGAQIMAPRATDMIAEIAVAMKCEGTVEELADTIHPHPTISEVIMEAAHDVEGLSCHAMPKK